MFRNNSSLRSAGERIEMTPELKEEWFKCAQDPIYFLENYYYIITIDEGKQLFKLRDYQKKIVKLLVQPPIHLPHLICNIPRQCGKTEIMNGYLMHYALFNADKNIAVLAHREKTAKTEILGRIKFAYQCLPLWLQQGVLPEGWNAKSLILENGSKITASASSMSSISGETVSVLYLDEFSKLPHHLADAFITATYPVISSGKSSKIIITSTPLGLNHYHDFWDAAIKRKNNFYPVKVKWQEVPGRDKAWKEKIIRDIGRLKFSQEFGGKFLGSSATLIDSEILESLEIKTAVEDKWDGKLLIYEPPEPNTLYIMGVDTGKGIGKDRSTIQVLKIADKFDIKQVAVYKNDKIGTYDFAEVCISVSKFYNGAYMMIESNGEGKGLVSTIWYEHEYDKLCNIDKKGLGIYANRGNRLEAHLLLKEYMEKEWLFVCDSETIYELSKYVEVKPNVFHTESPNGFDDLVTALFWALYFLKTSYFDDKDIGNKRIQDKFKLQDNEEQEPVMFFDEGANNNNISYNKTDELYTDIYNANSNQFDSDFLVL